MRHLTGKERITLSAVLWTVVLGGFALGVLFPLYLRLQNFPVLYRATHDRLRELEASIAKFPEVQREFTAVESSAPLLASLYLEPKDAVVFIEALERFAKDASLYKEIQLVSEPSGATQGSASSFVFHLTLVGSFEHLMGFLATLENSSYAVDVEAVHIAPAKSSQAYSAASSAGQGSESFTPSPGDVAASVTIRVYAAQ